MAKQRLDILVQRQAGLSPSKAQALIHAGKVFDENDTRLDQPG